MSVGIYALTTLDEAKANLSPLPARDGLWIYCSASGATAATAQVSDTTLVLIITGGGSAGTTTLTFSDAGKDTVTELVASINAVSGWKAGAIYHGDADSTDLVVTGALGCLGAANEVTLKIEDNYRLERLIDRATDIIERWASRKFVSRTYDRQVYSGLAGTRLLLDQYPVTRIGRVSIGRVNAFSVTCTTATNFATVEVTSTKVRLNADGVVTDKTIASSATINALITVINTVVGWSASLLDTSVGTRKAFYTSLDGTTKVSEPLPLTAAYCLSPSLAYVEVPDTDMTDAMLEGGSDEDRNPGILYSPGGWNYGRDSIYVDHVSGYSVIPAALEDLCLALVKAKYDAGKKDTTLQSESIGGVYAYSNRDLKQVSADILEEASYFRKLVL